MKGAQTYIAAIASIVATARDRATEVANSISSKIVGAGIDIAKAVAAVKLAQRNVANGIALKIRLESNLKKQLCMLARQ